MEQMCLIFAIQIDSMFYNNLRANIISRDKRNMAYDEDLAHRLRIVFQDETGVVEKKMFGGIAFMVHGHMCCGVNGSNLLVRVGADQYDAAVSLPHARPMDFTGRPMRGFVYVDESGLGTDENLREWINRGMKFVSTLPPK